MDFGYMWYKLGLLLGSRKFWVLLFSALAAYGLPIKPELQALIILLAGVAFAGSQAYEDAHSAPAIVHLRHEHEADVEGE